MFSQSAHGNKLVDVGPARGAHGLSQTGTLGWANWRNALLLIFATFAIRLIYLIWFCPYQLLGDEAYYWEQARHFILSTNEKAPRRGRGIRLCARPFAEPDGGVRFPVAAFAATRAGGVGGL